MARYMGLRFYSLRFRVRAIPRVRVRVSVSVRVREYSLGEIEYNG